MSHKLIYSSEAVDDMERVWLEVYEASQDFEVADRYIDDLRNAIREKKKYPKTGTPLVYMGVFTGLYYVRFKEYLVFYRITGENVEVGRVIFAKSDYWKMLF